MKTKNLFFYLLACLSFTVSVSGQEFNTLKADSLLNLLAEKNKAMGSMAISKDGRIIYSKAIGYSFINALQKIPATTSTKYRIGSISKMFTATIIFQLMEEGKIDLTTTLDKFYPTVPNAPKITMAQLLAHQSGIHSFTDDEAYLGYMTKPKTHDEMMAIISGSKADFEPGSKTVYSNSNFVLLGYIIEKICQKGYPEVLQERVCSKAGLSNTLYGGKTDLTKNESFSYKFDGNNWVQESETDMSIPHGAGAIVSTPADLVKFIEALFSGKLVSKASLDKMKPLAVGLGLGMQQFPFYDKVLYGHGGAIDGFNSMLFYIPEEGLAYAYCSNGTVYSNNDITIGALSIYFNKPYKLPVFTVFKTSPEELILLTGNYSSAQIPLKITISVKDGTLYGQATGQPSFPLEANAKNVFKFEQAGITMTFSPEKGEFILEQGGGRFIYTRDK
jgi:CubicO group peptidase (beta-lactamase class C family)